MAKSLKPSFLSKYSLIFTYFLCIIFVGCFNNIPKDFYNSWKPNIPKDARLNSVGQYWSNDSSEYHSLWQEIKYLENLKREKNTDRINSWIKIELVNLNKIKATRFFNNIAIDSTFLSGRLENNCFVTLQKRERVNIPLIYQKNFNQQYIFYNSQDGNLVLHEMSWNAGSILFFAGDGGGQSTFIYKKK